MGIASKKTIKKYLPDKKKFYSNKLIMSLDPSLIMVYGKRKNGKSFDFLLYVLKRYIEHGYSALYLRRWKKDIMTAYLDTLFNGHVEAGYIKKLTKGKWQDVCYYNKAFYLCNYSEDGTRTKDKTPFMYVMCLKDAEHTKSNLNLPNCMTLFFDEFLATAGEYIPGRGKEILLFNTILGTIDRGHKPDFKVIMIGNTLNNFCPYFQHFGLLHVEQQKPGTIEVYKYANGYTIAVERTDEQGKETKMSDKDYFWAFDDPTSKMTRSGEWEIDEYPLIKQEQLDKICDENRILTFFVKFIDEVLQCEIISDTKGIYCFCHRKTTPIRDWDNDIIYTNDHDIRPNVRDTFEQPRDQLDKAIYKLYSCRLFRYQDSMCGNTLKNYLAQFD